MEPTRPEPFPESLCHRCRHKRAVVGARSTFLMCEALPQRYLPQPVRSCVAFEAKRE